MDRHRNIKRVFHVFYNVTVYVITKVARVKRAWLRRCNLK